MPEREVLSTCEKNSIVLGLEKGQLCSGFLQQLCSTFTMSLTDLYNSFQAYSCAEMFTLPCKWLLGGGLELEDASEAVGENIIKRGCTDNSN